MRKRRTVESLSVSDAVTVFLAHRKGSAISPKTYSFEEWVLSVVSRAYPDVPVTDLSKDHLDSFFQRERERGISINTIRHILFAVRRLYKFLIAQGIASHNPADAVAAPRQEKKPIQPMDTEQVNALLVSLDVERFSGLRNKTILMLLWMPVQAGWQAGYSLLDSGCPL